MAFEKNHTGIFRYEELEQRILFSADAVPGADLVLDALIADVQESATRDHTEETQTNTAATEDAVLSGVQQETRWEIVFIDSSVADYEDLLSGLADSDAVRTIEIIELDGQSDAIDQITDILARRSDLSAVHFITHGHSGTITLGSTQLTSANLSEYSERISTWSRAFNADADILFYGCNVAADQSAEAFLTDIAALTGTDVAASDDPTGHGSLDGDWDLEFNVGNIESNIAVTSKVQLDWMGLLNDAPTDIEFQHETAAYSIAVANHSFEDTVIPLLPSLYSVNTIDSWDTAGNTSTIGTYNISLNPLNLLLPIYTAADGSKVGFISAENTSGGGTISQTLAETFKEGTDYTLSVEVGDSTIGADANWEIRLYAGTQLIGSVNAGDSVAYSPINRTFIDVTLSLDAQTLAAYSAYYGEFLKIELYSAYDQGSVEAHFDNVRLTAIDGPSVNENAANGTSVDTVNQVVDVDGGDTFTFSLIDDAGGRFAVDTNSGQITVADGSLINYEAATSHTITVRVTDSSSNYYDETITITVNQMDDAPVFAGNTSGSGNEDAGAITGTLTATDEDGLTDGTYFTIEGGDNAANGTASIDIATGAWSYTPNANYNGADSFTVTLTDDDGNTATQVISITVNYVDDPATFGGNTTGTGNEDAGAITGTLTANDPEGLTDGTYFTVTTDATHGTATIDAATGAWSYTPGANYNGADSFTVTVTDDDGNTTTQVISITVNQVDDPATFGGNTTGSGDEDAGAITGTLTATDAADGLTDGTYFTVTTDGTHGTAAIDAATGAWSYTPDANYNGADSFTVTLTDDDGNTATQVISITVNYVDDPATFGGNTTGTGDEDAGAVTGTLTANDPEGLTDGIYFTVTNDGTHGTATIDAATGAWSYTPDANYNGADNFTVTVTDDDGNTTTQAISITVNQVDDPATFGGNTTGTGNEDAGAITGTLTADDAIDGLTDGTYFTVTTDGTHGTATINAATGAWSYTPDAHYNGADSFTVTLTDDDGNTATQVISITVNYVDDPATFGGNTTGTGDEDAGAITGTLTANDPEGLTDGSYFTVTTDGSHGTATIDAATGAWSYTPDANYNGADSFTVTVTDDDGNTTTQVISITVNQVDDPATFGGNTTGTGDEDSGAITGTLTATDAIDGLTDGTYFTVTTNGAHGTAGIDAATGAWSYLPDADFNGTDSFTVTLTDDDTNTATQAINITVASIADIANDNITVNEDGTTTDTLLINDSFEGSPTITGVTQGSHGSVTIIDGAAGSVRYTPAADYNGSDSYTYTVTSGGVTETATVNVTVNAVNDAPIFSGDTSGTGPEDGGAVTGTLTATDADGLTDGSYFTIENGNQPANGTAVINETTGEWRYIPNAHYYGPDSFTVTLTDDDGNKATKAISLTVSPVEDLISADDKFVIAEDSTLSGTVAGNDNTLSGGTLIYTVTTDAGNGTVTLNKDGSFTYTPKADFIGIDKFTYTVTDSTSQESSTHTVTIIVTQSTGSTENNYLQPDQADPESNNSDEDDDRRINLKSHTGSTLQLTAETILSQNIVLLDIETISKRPDKNAEDGDYNSEGMIILDSNGINTLDLGVKAHDTDSFHDFNNWLKKRVNNYPASTQPLFPLAQSIYAGNPGNRTTEPEVDEPQNEFSYASIHLQINEAFKNQHDNETFALKIITAAAATFTIGIVSYLLKTGSFITSMLSTIPLWKGFDPIVIIKARKKTKKQVEEPLENADKIFSSDDG